MKAQDMYSAVKPRHRRGGDYLAPSHVSFLNCRFSKPPSKYNISSRN